MHFAAWMYVLSTKSCSAGACSSTCATETPQSTCCAQEALVFAFSINSDHWSNIVPRLKLQGLDSDAWYEITEPLPNNICQSAGTNRIAESAEAAYQLGYSSVVLPGDMLMEVGLPIKFYVIDDSVMFRLRSVDRDKVPRAP